MNNNVFLGQNKRYEKTKNNKILTTNFKYLLECKKYTTK